MKTLVENPIEGQAITKEILWPSGPSIFFDVRNLLLHQEPRFLPGLNTTLSLEAYWVPGEARRRKFLILTKKETVKWGVT